MTTSDKPLDLSGLAPIVGLRIREARTDKGMSQKDLVGERFSKSYISSIERGKITPSLKALEYIARRLNISVSYLLTGIHPGQNGTGAGGGGTLISEEGPETDSPSRWDFLLTEAHVLREQHRYEAARHLLVTKIRVRQLSVEQLKTYHFSLAQICLDLSQTATALEELDAARELAEKTGDTEMTARVRQLSGLVQLRQGRPVQAIEQLRLALLAVENGTVKDFHFRLSIYSQLAMLHHQLGDDGEATEMYRRALELAEESARPEKLAASYWNLAQTYRETGNLAQARLYANKSLALYESLADLRMLAELRSGFGVVMLEGRRFAEAEEQFQLARQLATQNSDLTVQTAATMHLADLYLEQNNLETAQHYSQQIEVDLDGIEPNLRGQVLSSRASLLAAQGDNEAAVHLFEEAVELIEHTPSKELLSKIYFRYARALSARGDSVRAAEMFERAYHQLGGRPSLVADR